MKTLFLLMVFFCFFSTLDAMNVVKTTCEYAESPAFVNSLTPRFGWQLESKVAGDKQTSYQIMVASSPRLLSKGKTDCWDSEKQTGGESQQIVYKGKPLKYGSRYYYKVRTWNITEKKSNWSDVGIFDTPVDPSSWKAQWVGAIRKEDCRLPEGRETPDRVYSREVWGKVDSLAKRSITLRKEFKVASPVKAAKVYVCGLGHYELSLNGKKLGDAKFAPLWSDYNKTVYYNMFDVTEALQAGTNTFGVMLGNGMYNVTGDRYAKFRHSYGPPTLLFQTEIEYLDGTNQTIISDGTWKYELSPVTYNCLFGGEDYDANLEQKGWDQSGFNDTAWKTVVVQRAPAGRLQPQTAPCVKIMKTYPMVRVDRIKEGDHVFDMGQNLSGFPTLKVQGRKGQKISIIVGEALDERKVTQRRSGGPYIYQYTLKGEGIEEWSPRFSYYGYQYIQVVGADWKTGEIDNERPVLLDLVSNFVHLSNEEKGEFECSSSLYNKVHVLIKNAMRSNMQAVFTDCPHREKLGWLEETHLNGPGLLFNYDLTGIFPKIQRDMADAQLANGLVPDIAPEYVVFDVGFRDSPEWGSAVVINPWNYYLWYGDRELLRTAYPVMRRYVNYLSSQSKDHILSHGLGDWYSYGKNGDTPKQITATAHYYYVVQIMGEVAGLLNRNEDRAYYTLLAKRIKDSFNRLLFEESTKQYGSGSQCSNAMPLFLDIVEPKNKEAVLNNLVANIRDRGNRLSTGDIGNRYLFQALAKSGRNDVMFDMTHHEDVPGYGFQVKMGVTTLTERWDPREGDSWNHFMMGQIDEWFYNNIAGINPDLKKPGFKNVVIQPEIVGDLTFAKGSYESLYGKVISSWKKVNDIFTLSVTIPVNSTATVKLPSSQVNTLLVGGESVNKQTNVRLSGVEADKTVINLPSGTYELTIKL